MRIRSLLPIGVLALAACTDRPMTAASAPTLRAASRSIIPAGTLDQNIENLLALLPHGLANAGQSRWDNIKRKVSEGSSQSSALRDARDMLFELSGWISDKSDEMTAPPNGESRGAAAARLTLYMAMYVYDGPSTPPPNYSPTADAGSGLVSPGAASVIVTALGGAGVAFDAGSVAENTIIVVSENPASYPAACAGPLATKVCQYPRFFSFNQFPHARLLKQAVAATCYDDAQRAALADAGRFRLAHNKPSNPADYTAGSMIRDQNGESIEVLPVAPQSFLACVGHRPVAGATVEFSDFDVVDPSSAPDRVVESVVPSAARAHSGDHLSVDYVVRNAGTAAGTPVSAAIRWSATPTVSASDPVLASVTIPAQLPGESTNATVAVTLPVVAAGTYYIALVAGDDAAYPDANLSNNTASAAVAIDPDFIALPNRMSVSDADVCALTSSNATWCWGDNTFRQFGQAGPATATPFAPPSLQLSFVEMSRGHDHSICGIKSDRSAVCWGRNGFGEVGNGTTITPADPSAVLGGINWKSITLARLSACGVSASGAGYCWGSNQSGEVGRAAVPLGGANVPASLTKSPALVDGGLTYASISAGWTHACGLTTSGDVYCWGANQRGQLGIGAIDADLTHRTPAPVVGGLHFIQISLGATYTCGITVDHLAYCWGENFTGQLGDGTTVQHGSPTLVAGGMHFSYIAAGTGFGDGSSFITLPSNLPPGPQAGSAHTCALTEDGRAYCWGWNGDGQLGDGTTIDRYTPTAVLGGQHFTSLGLGGAATCGMRGNAIWCWGSNLKGQLGSGSLTPVTTPAQVLTPFNVP